MARPKKDPFVIILELFDDLPLARQEQMLDALGVNHHLARRRASRKFAPPEQAELAMEKAPRVES